MSTRTRHAWLGLIVAALSLGLTLGPTITSDAAGTARIAGSWASVPAFPNNVSAMTVTAGADGRLYVFGFCDASCHQIGGAVGFDANVTEVYNPATHHWKAGRGAPASCGSAKASAATADGLIHLAGCYRDETSTSLRVAIYDPSSASWSMESGHGPFVDPIAGMTAPNGEIYWFSETLHKDNGAVLFNGYRVVIDDAGIWFNGTAVPASAPADAAVLGRNGDVYALGAARTCFPEFGTCPVPPVQAWRPLTNSWRQVTKLPRPKIQIAAAVDNRGRIFVMGGLSPDGAALTRAVQVYRPASDSWAAAAPLPQPRFGALATATPDGRVWLIGGYDQDGNPVNDGVVFNPGS